MLKKYLIMLEIVDSILAVHLLISASTYYRSFKMKLFLLAASTTV